ncbi:NUDIX hydrolase [Nesterenkonia flava]|uniref:NUDIX hydrolase n=1 Tax=Nesterenkonia flava TaxID=469799 RepID=A0ABU1FRA0_9MICC|nr:NUDIX hydrolase [Nesterenkonia flava]MDR5711143.1 NUDIX hydrolase [Nesterenkonia flava]
MSIQDSPEPRTVTHSEIRTTNPVFHVVEEEFEFGDSTLTRMYAKHLSAVAVVAVDTEDRVLLINQYRHPVRSMLWEIPAGLLDDDGETMLTAAQRELHEEADLTASRWRTLVDFYPTPGMSDEGIRVHLAEGLTPVPEDQRHVREAEESEIAFAWVPLEEAVEAVLAGRVHNGCAVTGILALHAARRSSSAPRDAHAPWPSHPRGFAADSAD